MMLPFNDGGFMFLLSIFVGAILVCGGVGLMLVGLGMWAVREDDTTEEDWGQ
jgi:hypothetical protein